MRPAESSAIASPAPSPEEELAALRAQFKLRLTAERARVGVLTGMLSGTVLDFALVFGDISMFAHRLRGAALVFEFLEIGNAAKELELATALTVPEDQLPAHRATVLGLLQDLFVKLTEATAEGGA